MRPRHPISEHRGNELMEFLERLLTSLAKAQSEGHLDERLSLFCKPLPYSQDIPNIFLEHGNTEETWRAEVFERAAMTPRRTARRSSKVCGAFCPHSTTRDKQVSRGVLPRLSIGLFSGHPSEGKMTDKKEGQLGWGSSPTRQPMASGLIWANPTFQARMAACVRSRSSNFFSMWLTWFLTVFSESTVFSATSILL